MPDGSGDSSKVAGRSRGAAESARSGGVGAEPAIGEGACRPTVDIVRPAKKRTARRHADPYSLVEKIKLWPSKTGVLHGVRSVKLKGGFIEVQTHCGQSARVRNSRNGRLARHLRNKVFEKPCPRCRIPAWKIAKFEETSFI